MTHESRERVESQVYCRRLQQPIPVSEHLDCPYCYGDEAKVGAGEPREFCDYDPGKDPIHFGFLPDSSRNARG